MQLVAGDECVCIRSNPEKCDESEVQQACVPDHQVERDRQARIHRAVGEDQGPVLGTDPARVVLDVLEEEGDGRGQHEEWNQHRGAGQRLVPACGTRFPDALERVRGLDGVGGRRLGAHARSVSGCPKRPWGRISSTVIRARNTNVSWNWVLIKPPARLSNTPSSIPPIMAPRMLPIPPMTAAVKALIPSR